MRLAGGDDRVDDIRTDIAHRREPEADIAAARGEVEVGVVDIGWQHLDAHAPALIEIDRALVLVILDRGEECGHVLLREVGLEVRRPEGHQSVAGGVRLVEGIVGEGDEDVPQCLDRPVGVAIGLHPLAEGDVLLVEDLLLLLAHRATQEIGVAEGVARKLLRDGHDLLLIDDQAVGVAEDLGEGLSELRMNGHHRLATVLAVGVVVVRIGTHRPGSVEGEDGRDVLEGVRLHRAQERAHRAAVQLEDPEGLAARQQIEGRAVGERKILEDDGLAAVGLDVGEAIIKDGEIAQPQEVHLEQAEGLARTHVELRDDRAILLASPHGDDVHKRLAAQDDACGVHAGLALQALKAPRGVDDLGDVGVRVVQRTELCGLAVARVLLVEDAG